MRKTNREGQRWSIILAGGDGVRMQPLIQRWLGEDKPMQYCAFVGTRSMFQHTFDRAVRVTAPERTVTVIAREHRQEAWAQLEGRAAGTVLLQPENRDTAAGILLPLTYIRARDPQATVVIYPSDHFIYPEDRFLDVVRHALWATESLVGRPILLAAQPDSLELEYGWIWPGGSIGWFGTHQVRQVRTFLEKPDRGKASLLMTMGGVWNTLVMAAGVEALWELGWQCFPDVMTLFERLGAAIDTSHEVRVLDEIYQVMPILNFSSDLLQRVPEQIAVMGLSEVIWSDWGKPERIADTLQRVGKQPAFSLEHLVAI